MIQSRRLEFNIQLGVFVVFLLALIASFITNDVLIGFICFYGGVGISQLISLIIKLFSANKFSTFMKIYSWMIMPIWAILLIFGGIAVFDLDAISIPHAIVDNLGSFAIGYLIFSLFFSPVLAMGFLLYLHLTLQRDKNYLH